MDEKPKEQANQQQPQQPGVGQHRATVQESADLLKRLAEFNSRKEDVLKKLADIGKRMESRLNNVGVNTEGLFDDEEEGSTGEQKTPKNPYQAFASRASAAAGASPMGVMQHQKFTLTRVRETPKPVFVDGCLNVAFPNKQAINDEWTTIAKDGLDATFTIVEDGVVLAPGCAMQIPTGLKVGLPHGLALHFISRKGLTVTFPTLFTEQFKEQELVLSVVNDTVTDMKLLFGIPLFTGYPIQLHTNINCEELLNSTYEDWVHGTINA